MVIRKIKKAIGDDKYKFESKEDKLKNRTILATFFVIVLVLALAVFIFINSGSGTSKTHYVYGTEEENKTVVTTCNDLCLLSKAVKDKNASVCEILTDKIIAQECFEKTAKYSLDSCLKVEDYAKRKECITENAVEEKSIDICLSLETETDRNECIGKADECYFKTGVAKNTCLAIRNLDYSLCNKNVQCILNYSDATKDVNACGQMPLEPEQYACAALGTDDDDECKKIGYMNGQDSCYASVAIWTNRSAICSLISGSNMYMRDCYAYFSIQQNELSYCNNVDLDYRWECYTNFSVGTKNLSGCDAINYWAKTSKKICYYDYAMSNRDPGACTNMEEPGSKVSCYSASIMRNATEPIPPQNCEKVLDGVWKDKCYMVSAEKNNDLTICDYIKDNSMETACLDKWKN